MWRNNEFVKKQEQKKRFINTRKEIKNKTKQKKNKKSEPIYIDKSKTLTYRGAVYNPDKKGLKSKNPEKLNSLSNSNDETNLGNTLIGCFAIFIGILIPPLGVILLILVVIGYIIEETKWYILLKNN